MSDLDSLLQQGAALHQAGRLTEASALYQHVLTLRRTDHDALHLLGLAQAGLGNAEAGIGMIRMALTLRPAFPAALFNLGVLLVQQGRQADALGPLNQALAYAPDHPGALAALGRAYQALGQHADAAPVLGRAVQAGANATDALLWNDYGTALYACQLYPNAVEAYRTCVRLRPNYADGHRNLGCALLASDQVPAARAAFEAALALAPISIVVVFSNTCIWVSFYFRNLGRDGLIA
jgi:tetratricopeptide (TPR) repeat protein